jgi:hypothetical protein
MLSNKFQDTALSEISESKFLSNSSVLISTGKFTKILELAQTKTVFSKVQVSKTFVISKDTWTSFEELVLFINKAQISVLSQFRKNLGI